MVNEGGAACGLYSKHLRTAIRAYELMPNEERLLHELCLETFDAGIIVSRVDLKRWAVRLRMRDAKGLRIDKCEKVFKSLVDLGIVDLNAAQGTYQLRPDPLSWSRVRAFYETGRLEDELKLCAERPLSDSLSELSREKALRGVPEPTNRDWHALFTEMNAAVQAGPDELERFRGLHPELFSAEKSADFRRKNPPTTSANLAEVQNAQSSRAFPVSPQLSAEKSADAPASRAQAIASCTSGTEEKLAKAAVSAEKSAECGPHGPSRPRRPDSFTPEQALEWVRSVDLMGQLADPVYGPQWEQLCQLYPNYVMTRLKRKYELVERKATHPEEHLSDPVAYLSVKARHEGRM